jgi:hypothetical protein
VFTLDFAFDHAELNRVLLKHIEEFLQRHCLHLYSNLDI